MLCYVDSIGMGVAGGCWVETIFLCPSEPGKRYESNCHEMPVKLHRRREGHFLQ